MSQGPFKLNVQDVEIVGPLPQPTHLTDFQLETLRRRAGFGDDSAVAFLQTLSNESRETGAIDIAPELVQIIGSNMSSQRGGGLEARFAGLISTIIDVKNAPLVTRATALEKACYLVLNEPQLRDNKTLVSGIAVVMQALGGRFAEISMGFHQQAAQETDVEATRLTLLEKVAPLDPNLHLEIVNRANKELYGTGVTGRSKRQELRALINRQFQQIERHVVGKDANYTDFVGTLADFHVNQRDPIAVLEVFSMAKKAGVNPKQLNAAHYGDFVSGELGHVIDAAFELSKPLDALQRLADRMSDLQLDEAMGERVRSAVLGQIDAIRLFPGLSLAGNDIQLPETAEDAEKRSALIEFGKTVFGRQARQSGDPKWRVAQTVTILRSVANRDERTNVAKGLLAGSTTASKQLANAASGDRKVADYLAKQLLACGVVESAVDVLAASNDPRVTDEQLRNAHTLLWEGRFAEAEAAAQGLAAQSLYAENATLKALLEHPELVAVRSEAADFRAHSWRLNGPAANEENARAVIAAAEAGVLDGAAVARALMMLGPDVRSHLIKSIEVVGGISEANLKEIKTLDAYLEAEVETFQPTSDTHVYEHIAHSDKLAALGRSEEALSALDGVEGSDIHRAKLLSRFGRHYEAARIAASAASAVAASQIEKRYARDVAATAFNDAGCPSAALEFVDGTRFDTAHYVAMLRTHSLKDAFGRVVSQVKHGHGAELLGFADALSRVGHVSSVAFYIERSESLDAADLCSAGGADVRSWSDNTLKAMSNLLKEVASAVVMSHSQPLSRASVFAPSDAMRLYMRCAQLDVARGMDLGDLKERVNELVDAHPSDNGLARIIIEGVEALDATTTSATIHREGTALVGSVANSMEAGKPVLYQWLATRTANQACQRAFDNSGLATPTLSM